jgi:hypothetical protein
MRLKANWRNWRVRQEEVESFRSDSPKVEAGDGKPFPAPPQRMKKRNLPDKYKKKGKGRLQQNKLNKGISSVKEYKFFEMNRNEMDEIHKTEFPHMLDWSKDSGLNRGIVKYANDLNDTDAHRFRRLGNSTDMMISKFAEDQCGTDIFPGNEFWDEDALLNRVLTKVPIHICRKDRELEKVVLILDTSPSCSEQAMLYANIARSVVGHGLVEMYDAPNGYITRKYCPIKNKFVEFMDADTLIENHFAIWKKFKNRHIIFFGDTDGWDIVIEAIGKNKVHWFMNIECDELDEYLSLLKMNKLMRMPKAVRKRIYTNIMDLNDFINAIKRLK